MKKINNAVKPHRSFRRFVKKVFTGWIKRQNFNCQEDNQKIIRMLQDMQDSIEIIARQIARWAKITPGE